MNESISPPTLLPDRRRLVVIPTYNEADNLSLVVESVLRSLSTDILVIDDNSPDGTGALADALAAREPRGSVIHRAAKAGLGPALDRGYQQVFQMDADGSHAAADLASLAFALESTDLAIGSRYAPGGAVENWSAFRRAMSRGGSIYSRLLLGLPVHDATSGFKGWRADLLGRVLGGCAAANGYVFQVEMTYRAVQVGATVCEVPILFADRVSGRSKFSASIIVEASLRVFALAIARIIPRAVPTT